MKYCHGNEFAVIDAVEPNNHPFEVILKCYDENSSEIKEMKWPNMGLSIEYYTNSLVNQISHLTSILEFDIPRKESMSK